MNAICSPPDAIAVQHVPAGRRGQRAPVAPAGPLQAPPAPPTPPRLLALLRIVADAQAAHTKARAARLRTSPGPDRVRARAALDRAQRHLHAAQLALAEEQRAAPMAETVLRDEHVHTDAGGVPVLLREPRVVVPPAAAAFRTRALDRMRDRGTLDAIAHEGGMRYLRAAEAAGRDLTPIGFGDGTGGGTPSGGNRRVEQPAANSAMLAHLRGHLSAELVGLVEHVVVQDLAVDAWANDRGMNRERAAGMLMGCLAVLGRVRLMRAPERPENKPLTVQTNHAST